MKRVFILGVLLSLVVTLITPFLGGGGPGLATAVASGPGSSAPPLASRIVAPAVAEAPEFVPVAIATTVRIDENALIEQAKAEAAALSVDFEHIAQKPVPKPKPVISAGGGGGASLRQWYAEQGLSCPGDAGGGPPGAPGITSPMGVGGTTSADLASFAYTYNAIRVANCLEPVPYGNFYYDSCMEARLFWMAESPSEDPMDAWGHMGSTRVDGVPSTGCDGNLAGGWGNSGATVASKWWSSGAHQASLYKPGYTGGMGGVCIGFAMSHGGVPNEGYDFTRAAAKWVWC